ncbi:MAG: hypothetical protein ABJD97_10465 [Betaproteobacteria bacterium]
MTPVRRLPRACAAASLLLAFALPSMRAAAQSGDGGAALTLNFAGTPYLHRWSQHGQNEFTPAPQPDLKKWRDMVTINVYDDVKTGEQLANVANNVLVAYQKAGIIVRTSSSPAQPGRPAQHMIVAVLSAPGVSELVFTRFVLTPEAGEALVYSHRVYSMKPDAAASAWFKAHDIEMEKALMTWEGMPSVPVLRALPQAQ